MSSEAEVLKKMRENMITKRAQQETIVAEWAAKVEKQDPAIFAEVDLPAVITLKALMPELYEEKPNKEVYEKQYEECMVLFTQVNSIVEKYNKEAMECLSQYQELASK